MKSYILLLCIAYCIGAFQTTGFVFRDTPSIYPSQNQQPVQSSVQANDNVNDAIYFTNPPPPPFTTTPRYDGRPQPQNIFGFQQSQPIEEPIRPAPQPARQPPPIAPVRPSSISGGGDIFQNIGTSSKISQGIYDLGQQILLRVLDNNVARNIKSEVISPLCIAGVGYLLYLGSAGQTETELANLLGLNRGGSTDQKEIHQQFGLLIDEVINDREIRNEDKKYPEQTENRIHEISIANALFLNNNFPLRQQYENVVRETYASEVGQMNFARYGYEAQQYIDGWVRNKTHGKIQSILSEPPTGSTQMIVVSALYFKALWWEELDVILVEPHAFYPDGINGAPINVDTILFTSQMVPYYQADELNCRIIGFRYQKQLSTMYVIQPLVSNRANLRTLQKQLTAENLDYLISKLKDSYFSTLTLPKFHLQKEVDLKPIFQQMGVQSLFGNANLSPIVPDRDDSQNQRGAANGASDLDYLDVVRKSSRYPSGLSVSTIRHKVDLTVNEKGTEGGAATAASVDKIAGSRLIVDTPFLFVVRQDNTRLPLFYGAVFEPEQD